MSFFMYSSSMFTRRFVLAALVLIAAGFAAFFFMRNPAETVVAVMPPPEAEKGTEPLAEPLDVLKDTAYPVSAIPFSDPDWTAPFRGAEQWHIQSESEKIAYPSDQQRAEPFDVYKRTGLRWDELETGEGKYNFKPLDDIFQHAIRRKQKVGFGIMTQYPGQPDGLRDQGAALAYPEYLHKKMQSVAEGERDYISPVDASFWVPNYNSEHYLSRFEALLQAIARHINSASFQGIPYRHAWGYADIRGFGSWGEWHMEGAAKSAASYPQGRRPLASSLKRIIDAHINAFRDVPLVAIISAFDADRLPNTLVPAEVGHYALTASNRWGKIGWRRDNWGWTENYLGFWMEKNEGRYNGMRFDTAIMNRWKYAPVIGECACGGTGKGGPCPFYDIPRQVRFYHASMIGNGNFCGDHLNPQGRDSMRLAWKLTGYRIGLSQVVLDRQVTAGKNFRIRADWQNTGVAPLYEAWDIWFELEDARSGKKLWSAKSAHTLRLRQPSKNAFSLTDNFALPASIPPGNYRLSVTLRDPNAYRDPLPLAVSGRRADGSYVIVESLQVGKP
ncbi:MAG: DUF4832 domain-containing protein [Chitinophagaceae bacterium]|nr:DUF4832 domain-containing protein [Chitinophagaceae bacterium]